MSLSLTFLLIVFSVGFQELVVCQPARKTRPYTGPPVIPVILPGGFIADTEEVARARDTHLRLLGDVVDDYPEDQSEEVQQRYFGASNQKYVSVPDYRQDYSEETRHRSTSPLSNQAVFKDPFTKKLYPGVGLFQSGEFRQQQQPSGSVFHGPPVVPVVLPSGHIADTAAVEIARQNHHRLAALAQQKAQHRFAEEVNQQPQQRSWTGPAAVTVVLPSGHLADTPEVADAKVYHLQQLLAAAERDRQQITPLRLSKRNNVVSL